MNLYYLTHPYETSWDCYDDMVIAADTEDEAKAISEDVAFYSEIRTGDHRTNPCDSNYCSYCISKKSLPYWNQGLPVPEELKHSGFVWVCEDALTVELIGVAADGVEKGLIIASNLGS